MKFDFKIMFPIHLDSSRAPLFPRYPEEQMDIIMCDHKDAFLLTDVDPDQPVKQVIGKLVKSLHELGKSHDIDFIQILEKLGLYRSEDSSREIFISRLNSYSNQEGFRIASTFDPNASICTAITSHEILQGEVATDYLLAWNGRDIGGVTVPLEGAPLKVNVHWLASDAPSRDWSLWVTCKTPIGELCAQIVKSLVQFNQSDEHNIDMAIIERGKKSRGHDKGLYCRNIYFNGQMTISTFPTPPDISNGCRLESLRVGMLHEKEIFVEKSLGSRKSTLAQVEVSRRNKVCTIFVGIRFDRETYLR